MKLILVFLVFAGGGLGACMRWLLAMAINTHASSSFPFGTLAVNLLGCFLIGLLAGLFERANAPTELRLFFITGVLGGFTTFSSFGLETVRLMRGGEMMRAMLYVLASNTLGIGLVGAGYALARNA
jgi:CrcB protein